MLPRWGTAFNYVAAWLATQWGKLRTVKAPAFIAPVDNALVTSGWGDDRSYRGGTHEGLDFRADIGTKVYAVAGGTVIMAANLAPNPAGIAIIIDHGQFASAYFHLSALDVKKGDAVTKGTRIGLSGNTGIKQSAPHLHFELRVQDKDAFEAEFFTPPSYGGSGTGGYSVPAEPFIPARYKDGVKERALGLGIPVGKWVGVTALFESNPMLALVGVGLLAYVLR